MHSFTEVTTKVAAGITPLLQAFFVGVTPPMLCPLNLQQENIVGYKKLFFTPPSHCSVEREVLFINSQSP